MELPDIPILSIVTFIPLIGALVVAILPARFARLTALGFALLAWLASLAMLVGYLPSHAEFQFQETASWIPSFGIQYKLGADGMSVALVVLTTTLTWISLLASFRPIQTRIKEYMISFLILEVGCIGVFLALGLPAGAGAAYSLARRGRELAWVLPGMVAFLQWQARLSPARAGEKP